MLHALVPVLSQWVWAGDVGSGGGANEGYALQILISSAPELEPSKPEKG